MSFVELFLVFLKASLLSSGGLQSLPLLRDDLIVQRGVLNEGDFATAISIGRVAPGPNGLFVLSVGFYAGGIAGILAAALAVMLPSFLAIGLVRAHTHLAGRPWVVGLTRGVTASSVGLLSALGYSFAAPSVAEPASFGIFVISLALLLMTKVDALLVLGGGALVAVILTLVGVPLA
ncbi:MAG: chromate transporter [Chloroflexi bacterium]|nr:chromate transporter [Chloroflexota bacterium]